MQTFLRLYHMFLMHIGGGGRWWITSQKSICIDGQRPTQASTSPYSVERLLNKLEICLTYHVSAEERLKRADMKPFSKEGMQHRWKIIGHNILRQDQKSHCNIAMTSLDTRKKKKKRKTKNHLEAHSWKGKGKSRMAIVWGSEDRSS